MTENVLCGTHDTSTSRNKRKWGVFIYFIFSYLKYRFRNLFVRASALFHFNRKKYSSSSRRVDVAISFSMKSLSAQCYTASIFRGVGRVWIRFATTED